MIELPPGTWLFVVLEVLIFGTIAFDHITYQEQG